MNNVATSNSVGESPTLRCRRRVYRIVTMCILAIVPFGISSMGGKSKSSLDNAAAATTITLESKRNASIADGCYHIFLDVGSNIGMHVRFLFEPHKYEQATIARSFFKKHFGPELIRDNRDFCIFSWEPNPSQFARHVEMKHAYDAMGWRYYPFHGGVSDTPGNLTFYHIGDETGFTMLQSSCRKRCDPEYVPVYRLSQFIATEIHNRIIPQSPYALHYENGPRVVMKMDIEMMEWIVFPDLLDTGVLCRDMNGMMGEFHLHSHWFFYPITFEHSRLGDNYTIQTWENASVIQRQYLSKIDKDPNCTIDLLLKDDESHRTDGMPWPLPNDTLATFG